MSSDADIDPADPRPRPPRRAPPEGSWDAHAHVFGPSSRFPLVAKRAYTPPDQPVADYLRMLGAIGLSRGVLSQPSVYGTDHRCLVDALKVAQGRLRGIVALDPEATAADELAAMQRAGVRGVRLNLALGAGPDPERIAGLGERLRAMAWHLEVTLDRVESLTALAPALASLGVPVVIEQMGSVRSCDTTSCPGFVLLCRLLEEGKFWSKLSHAYKIARRVPDYADTARFAKALIQARPDRLVWGSDWPHPRVPGPMPNDGALLDLLEDWCDGDGATIDAILRDNPKLLYDPEISP